MKKNNPVGRARYARAALTLIELLVVMAIIGVLLGLLLPALGAIRAATRRTQCQNNLHQIGVALTAYHEAHRTFPAGCVEWRPSGNTTNRQLAWSAYLLPHLDQQQLFENLDLTKAFDAPENAVAAAVPIPIYRCPSSPHAEPTVEGRGRCDYGGIYGERINSPNNPPKGTMLYETPISLAQIRDGASHTLIVSEDTGWPDGQWINGRNVFDQAFAINAAPAFENDIRSEHPGGAVGLFAGGNVQFLKDDIDLPLLGGLCTRAGGEDTSDFD